MPRSLAEIRQQEQWTAQQCAQLYPQYGVEFFKDLVRGELNEVDGYERPNPRGRGTCVYLNADSVRAYFRRKEDDYKLQKLTVAAPVKRVSMRDLVARDPEIQSRRSAGIGV